MKFFSLSTVVVINQKYTSMGGKSCCDTIIKWGIFWGANNPDLQAFVVSCRWFEQQQQWIVWRGVEKPHLSSCGTQWANIPWSDCFGFRTWYQGPEYEDGKWWCLRRCDRIHVMILSFIKHKECLNFDMLIYRHQSSIYKPREHLALIQ